MWPFSGDDGPTADGTTTARLGPDGTLRVTGPDWATAAPYVEVRDHGDVVSLAPTRGGGGGGDLERVETVDGAAVYPVGDALREHGIAPATLPETVPVEVGVDTGGERLLVDTAALADALVRSVEGGDEVIAACPRP